MDTQTAKASKPKPKQFKLAWMNVGDLKPNSGNPRTVKKKDFKKLIDSIRGFPQMMELRPIVIDEKQNILGGNQRYLACLELKWDKVPVVKASDLTEDQKREFIIKDNIHAGAFDNVILSQGWNENELMSWGSIKIKNSVTDEDVEVEFSVELDEASNYVILYFSKDIDWLHILSIFNLKSTYSKRQNGKAWSKGVGRIVDGISAIKLILKNATEWQES